MDQIQCLGYVGHYGGPIKAPFKFSSLKKNPKIIKKKNNTTISNNLYDNAEINPLHKLKQTDINKVEILENSTNKNISKVKKRSPFNSDYSTWNDVHRYDYSKSYIDPLQKIGKGNFAYYMIGLLSERIGFGEYFNRGLSYLGINTNSLLDDMIELDKLTKLSNRNQLGGLLFNYIPVNMELNKVGWSSLLKELIL